MMHLPVLSLRLLPLKQLLIIAITSSYFSSASEMLEPILASIIHNKKIVLASGSARRKEILSNIGLKFDIIQSDFNESSIDINEYSTKVEYVLDIAKHKVADVFENLKQKNALPDFIVGADTIVELNSRVFGKPKDKEQAVEFLKTLSGKAHVVHTAVVIRSPKVSKEFVESTTVHIAPLSIDVIQAYVNTNDPMDKAGAYGIQGIGGSLVERIEGDFFNVMGLPLHRFCVNLRELIEKSSKI